MQCLKISFKYLVKITIVEKINQLARKVIAFINCNFDRMQESDVQNHT